jgi:hypothetical protein
MNEFKKNSLSSGVMPYSPLKDVLEGNVTSIFKDYIVLLEKTELFITINVRP